MLRSNNFMDMQFPANPSSIILPVDDFMPALAESERRLTAVLMATITFTPETPTETKNQLMTECVQTGQQFGAVMQWQGSQLIGLLGIPHMYEDDAVQCAHMAWRLRRNLDNSLFILHYRFALSVATATIHPQPGQIWVTGESLEQAAMLLRVTSGDGIFVTDAFRSVTQHQFEFNTAVTTSSNVLQQPVWQMSQQKESIEEARGFKTLPSGLVGRSQHLHAMLRVAQNLDDGHGGIILLEGEPGIGKSRLMREFVTAVQQDHPHSTVIIGKCSPQRTHYPFSLFISLLNNTFNILPNDNNDKIRQKIQTNTQTWPQDAQEYVPYLHTLLGLSTEYPETEKINVLDPTQTRQQMFVAIRRILKILSQQSSMIILLDDLHWMDPISNELLLFLVTIVTTNPILFVGAQRRQGADAPNDRLVRLQSLLVGQTEKVFLERLSPQETTELLRNLLSGAQIPADFEKLIAAKSEGNPYFIEEFVRMFIEQKYVTQTKYGWKIVTPEKLNEQTVPLSLNALIQARVDALPQELKQLLRWSAAIGLYFECSLLENILPDAHVKEDLTRLASRLMVTGTGSNQDRWQFMHPLLHTAVYNAIPQDIQTQMHKTIASLLQKTWSEETPELAESLAYHLTQAGAKKEAIPYLIKAGELAIARHAGEEAVNNFQKASDFIVEIFDATPDWTWRITLGISDAYLFLGHYAESTTMLQTALKITETNPEFKEQQLGILRRLGEVTRRQGDVQNSASYFETAISIIQTPVPANQLSEATQIYSGLGWLYFTQSKLEQAERACQQSLVYAKQTNHLGDLAMAENLLGGIAYRTGQWEEAMRHTYRAMILREEMGYSWGVAASLGNLGILAFESGHWNKAVSYFLNSLSLHEDLGNIEGTITIQNNLAKVYQNQGNLKLAEQHYRKCLETAKLFNMPFHVANTSTELAHILIEEHKYKEAEQIITEGIDIANSIEAKGLWIELICTKGDLMLAQSCWNDARTTAEKTLPDAQTLENQIHEAILWRIIAESAYYSGEISVSAAAIEKAQKLVANSSNLLEEAKIAAVAYRIHTKNDDPQTAQNAYLLAHQTFTKLGATRFLEQLEANRN